MSFFGFGSSKPAISLDVARKELTDKLNDLASRVDCPHRNDHPDWCNYWLQEKLLMPRLITEPAMYKAEGGRRRKYKKTRKLRR